MSPPTASPDDVQKDADEQVVIALGDAHSSMTLAPHAGGRLMRWTVSGQEVIPWPNSADLTKAAKVRGGNPLLFPFIGRHRVDGRANAWRDGAGVIHALPQHGFARDLPFAYTVSDDRRAVTMTLASNAATREGYPFDFAFSAQYRLAGSSLEVVLEARNTGSVALPYYAGHHFYFALPHALREESRLTLPPTRLCQQLDDGSISAPQTEPDCYQPGDARIQDRFHLLANANGAISDPAQRLARQATLDTPSLQRRITLDLDLPHSVPWYALTTWTESDQSDFYCIEPWLGLPNAIHHGQGLRWIAPGGSEQARVRITATFGSRAASGSNV